MSDDWLNIMSNGSDDDSHEEEDSQIASRQERIRRAFDESKASYRAELVVLSPGWFRVNPEQVSHVVVNDRFGLQNLGNTCRLHSRLEKAS
jgi:hypothetical protein